jgi:hypothetical protein
LLIAPLLQAFSAERVMDRSQLWRPALSALIAAPFAAMLRAVLLQSPLAPIFVLVLGVTMMAGIVLWRLIFLFSSNRLRTADG